MVTHHLELGGDPKIPGFDKDDVDTTKLVQTVEKTVVVDFVKTMGKSTIHNGCFSKWDLILTYQESIRWLFPELFEVSST